MGILFAALGAAILYMLQGFLYARFWEKKLDASITFSCEEMVEGEENTLKEVIENKKLLPLPMLRVKFQVDRSFAFQGEQNITVSDRCYKNDIFSVLPYQRITRILRFTGSKRGFYAIGKVDLVASDLMMEGSLIKTVESGSAVLVYPSPAERKRLDIPFKKLMGSILTSRYSYEDPFEFRGIRPYQPFDALKDINWKASAKTGEIKVNVHNYTARQEVFILLNLETESLLEQEALKEESIRIGASLAELLISRGIPVGLLSNGRDLLTGEELFLPTGSGAGHYRTIRERLARLEYKNKCREFAEILSGRQNGLKEVEGKVLYVLISYSQRPALLKTFKALCEESRGSLWILPLFEDMELYGECPGADRMKWEVPDEKA